MSLSIMIASRVSCPCRCGCAMSSDRSLQETDLGREATVNHSYKRIALAVSLAAGGISGAAYGSGFQLMEQNASGLGNAYAGQAAAAENASTVFFNPAGMTRV